ncbi:MAG: S8 family serine peptidase [Eubacterium coprostanoligenes]|uniref:S8 family serine peptidase n=1 Tax=Eubacterium coprostanoligenes TaxID=290054 RepID=UPI00240904EE|nr:S8 family serine peptidase [Eubacterium coprostanoligenes]MDD6665660.1 S8 family serine peptidase [Eubacterium coprostanoligenes]
MKKKICIFLTFLTIILVMAPCTSVLAEEARKQSVLKTGKEITALCNEYDNYSNSNDGDKIDNRLMVKTNDRIDEYGAVDSVYGFGYAILQYADEESAKKAKAQYENSGYNVDYDSMTTLCNTNSNNYPQYTNWPEEWAYEETDAVSALDYYKLKAKSNINIAVVDSGINYNHELFKNRIVRTKMDFSTENSGDEMDTYDHGTLVSGTIVKSTPSNVKLYNYKIYNSQGKSTSSIALSAFEYIKQLKNKPDIINCSIGFGSGLGTVIDELVDMGITVVAAAGNDRKEVWYQPAIFDSTITVAATNYYSKACSFSNYGAKVDISAPGEYIHTVDKNSNSDYTFANGTSFAAPIVSAAAAYVLMEHRNYTPEQVKQEIIATATPFKKSDCYYDRYGAGIVNFSNIINGTRCKEVTANYISGAYRDSISVELKCANTLADIYYTTDGTLPTKENGTKYTEPFTVSENERVTAVAFARAGTPFKSKFTYLDYYILKDGESEYVIEKSGYSGIIKAYLGNETNVTVPDIVNGITPTELGENIFKNSNIESIVLPDTVTTIGDNAFYNTGLKTITANGIKNILHQSFYGCAALADIDLSNIKYIGSEALSGCKLLTQDLELPALEQIDEKGLAGTYFKTINLPECTKVGDSAFEGSDAQEIVLKKATSIGSTAFRNCANLETIYIPKSTNFSGCEGCTNLKTVFAPMATGITTDIPSNATIYCSNILTSIYFPNDYSAYKCTIVSPEYTPGLAIANSYGYADSYTHISSDKIAQSMGGQIRTRDNGLRFGFAFDEKSIGFDFKKYAQSIDYGFVYTFESLDDKNAFQINDYLRENNSKVFVKSSEKRNVDGTISTYNAVFTNIPKDHLDDKISARAYICIDGMYFYSPVVTRSYSSVANAVLNDSTVSEEIKKEIENSLKNGTTQKPSLQNNHTIKKTRFTKK